MSVKSATNIATLPGVVICNDDPRENVVKLIEGLLAEAKSGKIQSFGAFTIDGRGVIATCWATAGHPHAHHMVAAAVYLLRRTEDAAMDERI